MFQYIITTENLNQKKQEEELLQLSLEIEYYRPEIKEKEAEEERVAIIEIL